VSQRPPSDISGEARREWLIRHRAAPLAEGRTVSPTRRVYTRRFSPSGGDGESPQSSRSFPHIMHGAWYRRAPRPSSASRVRSMRRVVARTPRRQPAQNPVPRQLSRKSHNASPHGHRPSGDSRANDADEIIGPATDRTQLRVCSTTGGGHGRAGRAPVTGPRPRPARSSGRPRGPGAGPSGRRARWSAKLGPQ
jgi:hypothetical protein